MTGPDRHDDQSDRRDDIDWTDQDDDAETEPQASSGHSQAATQAERNQEDESPS